MMKLKERVLIAILTGIVLLTVILVLNVETHLAHPERLTPSHAKVQYNFRHRQLQKTANGSREGASQQQSFHDDGVPPEQRLLKDGWGAGKDGNKETKSPDKTPPHDPYQDLAAVATKAEDIRKNERVRRRHWNPSIGELLGIELRPNATLWDRFHVLISRDELYPLNDVVVPALLRHVSTAPIVHMAQKEGGTQLKLILGFSDGGHALVKPMRFTREQQTLKNHFYFTDFERHNAEIAAFHLDRLLGFRRSVPITGRLLNITKELYALAQGDLLKTFFISPDNNLCFHGKCSYYCDTAHAICGSPDMIEGSLAIFLPGKDAAPRKVWRHPWRRSYHKRRRAQWEVDDEYCDLVREVHPYNEGRRLLDLMDMSVLDFLMGNMDRHHYETFKGNSQWGWTALLRMVSEKSLLTEVVEGIRILNLLRNIQRLYNSSISPEAFALAVWFAVNEMFGNNSAPIHLDHGRGFGKPFHDELSILAPIYQCCLIRHSTLSTLIRFHNGPKHLSEALIESLAKDPLSPVLWEPHLTAVDRRLAIILQMVRECVRKAQHPFEVVINDFH